MSDYSVLMTVYKKDVPEFVRLSIDSMLAQTQKTNDFVLVCDGELTEELDMLIEKYSSENDFLSVYRLKKNVGLGAALNFGLPKCKNEYVARMDDDDIALADRCKMEVDFLDKNPHISVVGSYVNEFEDSPDNIIRTKTVPVGGENILKYSKRRNPFNHPTVMFRKSDILAAGNYKKMRTNQDVELWVRLLSKGYKGENITRPLVNFRFDTNTYKRRKDFKNLKLMIDIWHDFLKNGYCSRIDFLYVVLLQTGMYILPEKLLKFAYDHLR